MNNTINGRTPEEIYKALRCVITQINDDCEDTCDSCKNCPNNFDGGRRELAVHLADAIVRIQQLERERDAEVEAQPKWISVEERLPEENFEVLMLFKHNMAVGCYDGEGEWCANTDDGYHAYCDGTPTHWMPLPEAPQEV